MDDRVQTGGLSVAGSLHRFVVEEALPGTGVDPDAFWAGADAIIHDLAPRNRELLARRDDLQTPHRRLPPRAPGTPGPRRRYTAFLTEIGYLARRARRGLGDHRQRRRRGGHASPARSWWCPLLNARFATNAANARWGSLYDALYGSDVVPREGDLEPGVRLQRGPGDRGDPSRPGVPRRALPARDRLARRRLVVHRGRRGAGRHGQERAGAAGRPVAVRRPPRRRRALPRPSCWCTTACTSRSRSTPRTPSARTDAAGVKDLCWRPRSPRSWTSRTPSPPSTPRTRCSATATGSG